MYLEENVELINKKLRQLQNKKHILVWGASENTVRLFQYTDIAKYIVKDFVDIKKAGRVFLGKMVRSPKDILWAAVDAVVISSFYKENEIEEELITSYGYQNAIIKFNSEKQKRPFYEYLSQFDIGIPEKYKTIIDKNSKFKNIHQNQRVFILCNGPSINELDLRKLRNEKKIAVSNFYMHKDFNIIKPDYYCIARMTYTDIFTETVVKDWFKEMEKNTGDIQFFFSIDEKELIDECNLFADRKINYLYFGQESPYYDDFDLTLALFPVQSVSVMCIQIALYMGFKEIYLIGTEHSEIRTGEYRYFYKRNENAIGYHDSSVNGKSEIKSTFDEILSCTYRLWNQYKIIKEVAERKEVKIYNATKGGILDVFERVAFDDIFVR